MTKWKSAKRRRIHHAGCSKVEPKMFAPPQAKIQSAGNSHSPYQQTQFGEDRCTQFWVIMVTDPRHFCTSAEISMGHISTNVTKWKDSYLIHIEKSLPRWLRHSAHRLEQFVGRRRVQFSGWAVDSMFGFQGPCFKMNFSDRQEGLTVLDVLSNYPLLSQR